MSRQRVMRYRFDDNVARNLGVHRSDLRAMHLLEHGPVTAGARAW